MSANPRASSPATLGLTTDAVPATRLDSPAGPLSGFGRNRPSCGLRTSLIPKSVFPSALGYPKPDGASEDTGASFRPVGDDLLRLLHVIEHPRTLLDNRRFPTG